MKVKLAEEMTEVKLPTVLHTVLNNGEVMYPQIGARWTIGAVAIMDLGYLPQAPGPQNLGTIFEESSMEDTTGGSNVVSDDYLQGANF